jgi:large subunit ribosomal protein L31e
MGKKSKLVQKGKGEKKELQALSRRIKVNLHKQLHGVQFKKKAPCAVKVIKELVKRNMLTKDVRIDPELNKEIWKNGVRNLPTRVEIIMERKKNEDEEEGQEKMYTLVKLAPAFEQA